MPGSPERGQTAIFAVVRRFGRGAWRWLRGAGSASSQVSAIPSPKSDHIVTVLCRFFDALLSHPTIPTSREVAKSLAALFEADIVAWFRVRPDGSTLHLGHLYLDGRTHEEPLWLKTLTLEESAKADPYLLGLTASVVASRTPLSLNSHTDRSPVLSRPGGATSISRLYPDGIDHPSTGLLSLHAVPLFIPEHRRRGAGDLWCGVLRLERRRHRGRPFSPHERTTLELVAPLASALDEQARHLDTATWASVGHDLMEHIGNVALAVEQASDQLPDAEYQQKYRLKVASDALRSICVRIRVAADATHSPSSTTSVTVLELLASLLDDAALRSGWHMAFAAPDELIFTPPSASMQDLLLIVQAALTAATPQHLKGTVRLSAQLDDKDLLIQIRSAGAPRDEAHLVSVGSRLALERFLAGRMQEIASTHNWELSTSRSQEGRATTTTLRVANSMEEGVTCLTSQAERSGS